METQDHRKATQSGHEGHVGAHICHKCGWPFPNAHPSARHRRAHKRVCGTIEGYKLDTTQDKTHLDGSDGEQHVSDDENKTPSEKVVVVERNISRRSSSGVGSRSSRSTRSEDDVFADAVTDFVDSPGLEEASKDAVRSESSLQKITESDPDCIKVTAEIALNENSSEPDIHVKDNQLLIVQNLEGEKNKTKDGVLSQDCVSSSANNPIPVSASVTRENEIALGQHMMQNSRESIELNLGVEDGKEASNKDLSEHIISAPKVAGNVHEVVSALRTVSEEQLDSVSADGMVKPGMQADGFERKVEFSHEVDSPVNVHALANSAEFVEDENIDKSTDVIEEQDSNVNSDENMHVVALPDALPVQEHPEIKVEDLDHKGGKFNISMGLDAALAFKDLVSDKDLSIRESSCGSDFGKSGKSIVICAQGDVLEPAHFTENTLEQDVGNIVGEANQKSDIKACNIGELEGKELLEDIKAETWEKEISDSKEKKCSIALDNISFEDAVVDSGENQEIKSNSVVVDDENYVVLENDRNQLQGEELAATSSTLAESPPVKKDIGDDVKVKVEGTTLNVNERIGGDDESNAVSAETAPGYGLSLPGCQEGYVEAFEPDRNHKSESHVVLDSGNVVVGHSQPESSPTAECVRERQSIDDYMGGEECIKKDSTCGVAKIDDNLDSPLEQTQIGILEALENAGSSLPSSTVIGDSCTADDKVTNNASSGIEEHGSTEEHVGVAAVDTLMDSNSQTDSLEGNWGSFSVLSAISESDTPPATDTAVSNTSQASLEAETVSLEPKAHEKGQESPTKVSVETQAAVLEQNKGASEIQTSNTDQLLSSALQSGWSPSAAHTANNPLVGNRNKEIIAKVTNWSTEKQHTPLKTLLGEATARSRAESPNHDDNSVPDPKKEEIPLMKNGLSANTEKVVLGTRDAAVEEIGKEWNSPARYPVNIKTEKRRAKTKSYWTPFLCCSSVNAAR